MQKMFKAIFCDICGRVAFQEQFEGGFQDTLTTQDWVTDWQVTTDFNGFPLKYPRVIDLCPQCRAMYGKRPLGCNVTRSVSKMTEIERRGGKRWDKPKKAEKSRDCGGGKF